MNLIFVSVIRKKIRPMLRQKNIISVKTEKKNRIIVEEVNPNEIKEIWERLSDLNDTL